MIAEEVCGIQDAVDFILVVDGSTSIGKENFRRLANWLADAADDLPDVCLILDRALAISGQVEHTAG